MLQHGEKGSQIIMDGVPVPPAIFSIALETDSTTQDAILEASLQRLVDEDNSLELNIDSETGETLLSGMGELHLEVAIDHLNRILPFSIHRSSPRVSYRETVTSTATHTEHHDATVGLQHHQATVQVTLQPTEEVGNIIDIPDSNNASPDQKAALLDGAQAGLNRGPIYNAKMAHTKATLIQTCTSDKPPTLPALRAAAAHGVRKCAVKHNGLLEPELSLEITAPHTHMGNITRDLTHGRHSATIESMERTETHCIIRGSIAATSLLKCAARIRSNTQGRAVVRTSFRRYAPAQGHHHA